MAQMPDPFPSLLARIKRIEDRLNQRLASSPFFGTGVHPNGSQGLDSDNYVAGASGFSLNGGTGNAEFNDITLRDLPNSALANPLDPARLHDEADAFAVTGTGSSWNNILSVSVTVPTGFTQALVLNAVTAVSARNNSASPDFVYARCQANGTSLGGWILASTTTAPGDYGITNQIQTGLLEGLSPGSTLTFTGQVSVTSSWGTDASNIANLDVVLLWLR